MSSAAVRLGIIGLGARTETLLATMLLIPDEVRISAVCDLRQERIEKILGIFRSRSVSAPETFTDYHRLIESKEVDAVLVPTSWNSHLAIARDAMRMGKYVGIEVGGAASVEELWELVRASEETRVSCMMLENCCYGRNELMVLNLVRRGLFGELVYCEGGYEHDLRDEIIPGLDTNFERTKHNLKRNGELYPTHGLGPIAKILRINKGNRFLTLSSSATKACGFHDAARKAGKDVLFREGDMVTTTIRCANGENILLRHSISLPRPYSRDCRVQGTRGCWLEDAGGIFIEGISPSYQELDVAGNPYGVHEWTPVEKLYEEYDHPIWADYRKNVVGGHGGMDTLALRAFLDAVRNRTVPPIDVYDCASWMSVTALSEQSIAMGGAPVPFPDFTNGKWIDRAPDVSEKWSLDGIPGVK